MINKSLISPIMNDINNRDKGYVTDCCSISELYIFVYSVQIMKTYISIESNDDNTRS